MILTRLFLPLASAILMATDPIPPAAPVKILEHPATFTGPVAIQTFAEVTFLHHRFQSTQAELPSLMRQRVPQFERALKEAGIASLGPLLVVYQGMTADPAAPFQVEIGVRAPTGTKAAKDLQVRLLPAFTCATTVFTGPLSEIGKVYQTLYPSLVASGKAPLPESRQMILFWEGDASPNNLLLVQIGVQQGS